MKGLLLNGFYSAVGNIKLFLTIVTAAGIILLITGNPTAQELFVYITITAFSVNGVVSMRKDSISKWNKYEITMPVRRKDIVMCKYISYVIWVLSGTLLAALVTGITLLIHGVSNLFPDISLLYSMFVLGIGISVLSGSFFYPLSYLFGSDKSETVLIISVLAAVGSAIAALNQLNRYIEIFSVRLMVFAVIFVVIFAVSYCIALRLYLKKEF